MGRSERSGILFSLCLSQNFLSITLDIADSEHGVSSLGAVLSFLIVEGATDDDVVELNKSVRRTAFERAPVRFCLRRWRRA
jgi:hypothetical protein